MNWSGGFLGFVLFLFSMSVVFANPQERSTYVHTVDLNTGISCVKTFPDSNPGPSPVQAPVNNNSRVPSSQSIADWKSLNGPGPVFASPYMFLISFLVTASIFFLFIAICSNRIATLGDIEAIRRSLEPVNDSMSLPALDAITKLFCHSDTTFHARLHTFFFTQSFTFAAIVNSWGKPSLELTVIPLGAILAGVLWYALACQDQSLAFLRSVLGYLSTPYKLQHKIHFPRESELWERKRGEPVSPLPKQWWMLWLSQFENVSRSSYFWLVWVAPAVAVYIWVQLSCYVLYYHWWAV
jgi:hypothetical protein